MTAYAEKNDSCGFEAICSFTRHKTFLIETQLQRARPYPPGRGPKAIKKHRINSYFPNDLCIEDYAFSLFRSKCWLTWYIKVRTAASLPGCTLTSHGTSRYGIRSLCVSGFTIEEVIEPGIQVKG